MNNINKRKKFKKLKNEIGKNIKAKKTKKNLKQKMELKN
jgi:hypothetical protein